MRKTLLALFLASLFLCAAVAQAAPRHPQRTRDDGLAQVDGILSRVVDNLTTQRDVYWHHGDYPRIIALDRISTQLDPQDLECYETGGWLMESLGDLDGAEAYYRQGVANNPGTSESYFHLGFFYFNTRHDYRRAIDIFRRGTSQPDADINDWKMLAHSYEHAQEYAQAVATWQHIQARWPHGVAVAHNLSEALAMEQRAASGEAPAP